MTDTITEAAPAKVGTQTGTGAEVQPSRGPENAEHRHARSAKNDSISEPSAHLIAPNDEQTSPPLEVPTYGNMSVPDAVVNDSTTTSDFVRTKNRIVLSLSILKRPIVGAAVAFGVGILLLSWLKQRRDRRDATPAGQANRVKAQVSNAVTSAMTSLATTVSNNRDQAVDQGVRLSSIASDGLSQFSRQARDERLRAWNQAEDLRDAVQTILEGLDQDLSRMANETWTSAEGEVDRLVDRVGIDSASAINTFVQALRPTLSRLGSVGQSVARTVGQAADTSNRVASQLNGSSSDLRS